MRLKVNALTAALLAAALSIITAASVAAQGTVYESKDKAGPVFSGQPSYTDKPTAAKPVAVPPMNTMQGVTSTQQPAPAAPAAPAPAYDTFAISSLADADTVHTNTGAFDVRATISPALRSAAGDRIRVKLDGNLLAPSYKSGKIRISAADFQGAARADNVEHTLQAAIIDKTGALLIESAPITFYAHRATVRRKVR